jgi:hypothetical protein
MCVCARPIIIGERARNTPAPAGPAAPRPAAAAPSSLSSQFYHWHLPVSYAMYTQNLSCGPGWVRDRVGLSARHIHCTGKRSLARRPEVARLGRRLRVPTLRLPEVLLQRRHPRPPAFLISVTNIYRTVGTPNRSRLVVHHWRSPVRHANIYIYTVRLSTGKNARSFARSLAHRPAASATAASASPCALDTAATTESSRRWTSVCAAPCSARFVHFLYVKYWGVTEATEHRV